MDETSGAQVRWGTALGLLVAVIVLSALDSVPLVTLPLAIILLAVPSAPRWKWIAMGLLIWLFGVTFPVGALGGISRGWAFVIGGAFLVATLTRPTWGVLSRALAALAAALVGGAVWLTAAGRWSAIDEQVREHLVTVSKTAMDQLQAQSDGSDWVTQMATAAEGMALLQWELFPALIALQSLAALALVSWTVSRLRRGEGGPFVLRPLREFRFNDQLVWVLIVGLVLVALPLSAVATRAGMNALLFMSGLYALRGLGIFVFLMSGPPSLFVIVAGGVMLLFVYPLVLATAVVVGIMDTWLDLRARARLSPRP